MKKLPVLSFASIRRVVATVALVTVTALPAAAQVGRQAGIEAGTPVTHGGEGHTSSPPIPPPQQVQLLPAAFAGEPRHGDIVDLPAPGDADAAHAAVLKEDGFVGASRATYAGDGLTGWTVEVLRFGDATGAYSAFTFFRNPDMHREPVGDDAAASTNLFLTRLSASLVLVRPSATALRPGQNALQLQPAVRALVSSLPRRHGPDAIPPILPRLLPPAGLDVQTLHYAVGPASYNGPIPVTTIEFDKDAEAATAAYHLPGGRSAAVTLLMLPTPQIAVAEQQAVSALPQPALHVGIRRIGPLVAVVSGTGVSVAEAAHLLGDIHYTNDITLDQPQGYTSEVAKAAKLLVGIAWITIALALAALVLGVFFGLGRVLIRRMRGKPDSSLNDEQFISLKL